MALNFEKQNERVIEWGDRTTARFANIGNALGIVHRADSPSSGASLSKIKDKFKYKDGIIEVVSFKFPRSLIWPHKGAGKGMGGNKGSSWVDKYGQRHTTDSKSFGKAGTGNRRAKPWFNQTIEGVKGVDELATIVAEETGDAIVNNLFIR